jgi:hypothetical protein
LAIFASSRRSGGLMTKGAAMLSSITYLYQNSRTHCTSAGGTQR